MVFAPRTANAQAETRRCWSKRNDGDRTSGQEVSSVSQTSSSAQFQLQSVQGTQVAIRDVSFGPLTIPPAIEDDCSHHRLRVVLARSLNFTNFARNQCALRNKLRLQFLPLGKHQI